MTQQVINVGASPNDGDGNPIRTAFIKCNDNFSELYSRAQTTPPPTLIGSPGDSAGMYAYDSSYFYYCFANYNGSTVIWAQVTQIGNVSLSSISSGNSSVELADVNGNATVSVAGVSNVAVFTTTGQQVTGAISATGNITGDYILGNGSQLTGLPENYSNANVAAYLPTYSGNISAGNIAVTTAFTSGNILTSGLISTSGNIASQGRISATGNIETTGYFVGTFVGNVTGNFVVPGSNTQIIFNTNGSADATSGLTFDTNGPNLLTVLGTISSQGNVIAGNISTAGIVSATGDIITTSGNLLTPGRVSAAGNVRAGNINTVGAISATGNVIAGNISTAGIVSATGDIITTSGNLLTPGRVSAAGNVRAGNINTVGAISATGNVTTSANVSAGNIQITGIGGYGQLSVTGNTIVGGDLTVNGNLTYINVTDMAIEDPIISIGRGANNAPLVSDDGKDRGEQLWYYSGSEKSAFIGYDNSAGKLLGATSVTITNELVTILDYGTAVFGNIDAQGSIISTGNITGGNITTNGLISAAGNITGGNIRTAGLISATSTITSAANIQGGNIRTAGLISATGNITGAAIAGSSLTVNSGSVTCGNIVNSNANGVGNIGSSTTYFNTVFAQATSAQYADLAESYLSDSNYAPGTVVEFGGSAEVTQCNSDMSSTVVGVVSTRPAYLMNSGLTGDHVAAVALIGRVPCQVHGPVARGALMVSAGNGRARAESAPAPGTILGKAVESFEGDTGIIEILVGRV